ncbi:site-specific integrase [Salmonella enterica]|nr:site-specific integrase [Salmonella enterica]
MTLDHASLQGLIEHNPARLLKPAMFGASMSKPRERWLPREELQMLWKVLDEATIGGGSVVSGGRGLASSVVLSRSVANALRLIIFTGARRSEAAEMRWDQINGDRWTIPATKNGKNHVVTLHPSALSLLKEQRLITEGAYVFGSTSKPGFPITGDALTRALERVRVKYMGEIDPFSPHDLRRSVATGCAEYLDAPERLIELLLNHVPKDRLIRTYQVGQQAEKLRKLFLNWGDFIQQEVINTPTAMPDNVVQVQFGSR